MTTRRPRRARASGELAREFIQYTDSIRACEQRLREVRKELINRGRLDLARQSLKAPVELQQLAGLLWYGRPAVIAQEALIPSQPSKRTIRVKPQPIKRRFQRKFELVRSEDETRPVTKSRAQVILSRLDGVQPMFAAKAKSDLLDAMRKRGEIIDGPKVTRELAIQTAVWSYPLEEWATIFPDAALANDYDFIKRIVDQFVEIPPFIKNRLPNFARAEDPLSGDRVVLGRF